MSDQEKIALLTLALAGAVGALEACETAFKHDGRHNTAKFCADLVVDYRKTLDLTRPMTAAIVNETIQNLTNEAR